MKALFLLAFLPILSLNSPSQDHLSANVDKILNMPIFMYSYPSTDFEEVDNINANWSAMSNILDENVSIDVKVKEIINTSKRKLKKGKVADFNAIIISPDDYTGILIKLSDKRELNAEVVRVLNVPVFMYSYPANEYDEVKQLTATFSILSSSANLAERVTEIIRKAKKQEAKGKIGQFDAIIISPDDFTGILIKYKE